MKAQILRYFLAILILVVIIFGVMVWIGNTESLTLTGFDKVVEISAQKAFLVVTAYTIFIMAVWALLRFLWDLPHRIKTGFSRHKQGQALEALEDAMIAASAGNADKAKKKASRARALINRPALAQIVSAQAAEVSGDPVEAEAQYTKMLDDDKTRRVAQRGLAALAYARGDLGTAIIHAQQAYADNKDAKWAFDILFNAQVSDGQWTKALETLESGERRRHVSKGISRRRKAVLLSAKAASDMAIGDAGPARDLAVRSASGEPGFAPGVALAASLLVEDGQGDKAGKLIEKAWGQAPHPALALAYRDLQQGETPKVRARRMKSLMKQNSTHRETVLLGVEESLRAGDAVSAWGTLRPLTTTENPSARVCELAAKAEELCKNAADASLWTARAATAPVEPNWSDLDPDGTAFNYSEADWRRLVYSYGDTGELIHPRHERFETTRPAIEKVVELKDGVSQPAKESGVTPPVLPDDPGVQYQE